MKSHNNVTDPKTIFNPVLFWDAGDVDPVRNAGYVISRVMNFGDGHDIKKLNSLYPISKLIETVKKKPRAAAPGRQILGDPFQYPVTGGRVFEEVLPVNAASILQRIAPFLQDFYLAGGMGLALQLGHRKSADFDFFSDHPFNIDLLISRINPDKILMSAEGILHCESDGVKLSFLYYSQPRLFPAITWQNVNLTDWRDISAEKMKAISQRGSKKDFVDLYTVIKLKSTIEQVCQTFKDRFSPSTNNYYHVLRSLTFFEEAEVEPEPVMVMKGVDWEWQVIKEFFLRNIQVFEKQLSS